MARARRTSAILETARQGLNGLKSITPKPNLGPNLTPDGFAEAVTSFIARLDTYNQHVADLDQEQNQLEAAEVGLRDQNRRILLAVATQFEPDSSEYEKAARGRASASVARITHGMGLRLRPVRNLQRTRIPRVTPAVRWRRSQGDRSPGENF